MKYLKTGIVIVLTSFSASIATGGSYSSDYAKLSLEFQNTVQCVAYADTPQNQDSLRTLAPNGISQGRRFVSAAIDRKIEAKDWTDFVPMEYRLRIQGPTTDFVVGRLWEATETSALTEIFNNCTACQSDQKLLHIRMNLLFDQHRCDAIN